MSQNMETGRRIYSRVRTSLPKTAVLVCRPPAGTVWAHEHKRATRFAGGVSIEQCDAILGEYNVPRPSRLTGPHADGPCPMIEVRNLEPHDFPISASGKERALDQRAKAGSTGIHQSLRLCMAEIANFGCIRFAKWLHTPPCIVRFYLSLAVRQVKGYEFVSGEELSQFPFASA
jgi:hypothetical protein